MSALPEAEYFHTKTNNFGIFLKAVNGKIWIICHLISLGWLGKEHLSSLVRKISCVKSRVVSCRDLLFFVA
jgi:hypothetical protein